MSSTSISRILVVDDEQDVRDVLCDLIESSGLQATAVADGAAMNHELAANDYALLILDLRLRREDGLTLARAVRQTSNIPIMILTGKGDETDRISSRAVVADAFLRKPFNPRELLALVRALLRRSNDLLPHSPTAAVRANQAKHDIARFGDWSLDFTARALRDRQLVPCALTPGEYSLLETLVRNANRVLTRDPVSYTHLDVYKRQVSLTSPYLDNILTSDCQGGLTHLLAIPASPRRCDRAAFVLQALAGSSDPKSACRNHVPF